MMRPGIQCPQAVTTAVGHKLGLGSPLFAVALAFSLIVMYDAANVRWHAGWPPPNPCLVLACFT